MSNDDRCSTCGAGGLVERVVTETIEHHGKSAVFEDRQTVCPACGSVSYIGQQISDHELAVAGAIRALDGLLSAEELFRIRTKYRLRQTDMEQMLSTGPKTWTRWERGKIPQSKAADTLIRVIAEDPDVARRLMVQSGVENDEAAAAFAQIEQDARRLARAMMRSALGAEMGLVADQVADKAFDAVRDGRRQAALGAV